MRSMRISGSDGRCRGFNEVLFAGLLVDDSMVMESEQSMETSTAVFTCDAHCSRLL